MKYNVNNARVYIYGYYSNYVFLHNFAWSDHVGEFWVWLTKMWSLLYYTSIVASVLTLQIRQNILFNITLGDVKMISRNTYVLDPSCFIKGFQANPILNVKLCLHNEWQKLRYHLVLKHKKLCCSTYEVLDYSAKLRWHNFFLFQGKKNWCFYHANSCYTLQNYAQALYHAT